MFYATDARSACTWLLTVSLVRAFTEIKGVWAEFYCTGQQPSNRPRMVRRASGDVTGMI
jgi:hypothetical protein